MKGVRVASVITLVLLVATTSTAGATTGGAVGHRQAFVGRVNGSFDGATIDMACFGPITPGQTGHPMAGQVLDVLSPLPPVVVGPIHPANTGSAATTIVARLRNAPRAVLARFTNYFQAKEDPHVGGAPVRGDGCGSFRAEAEECDVESSLGHGVVRRPALTLGSVGSHGVNAPVVGNALQRVRAPVLERSPEPATRSLTVPDTRTSPAPARAAIRAPMWTARPRTSSPDELDLARVQTRPGSRGRAASRDPRSPARSGRPARARRRSPGSRRPWCRSRGRGTARARRRTARGGRQQVAPRRVAERRGPLGRADDVGEQHGRQDPVAARARCGPR